MGGAVRGEKVMKANKQVEIQLAQQKVKVWKDDSGRNRVTENNKMKKTGLTYSNG